MGEEEVMRVVIKVAMTVGEVMVVTMEVGKKVVEMEVGKKEVEMVVEMTEVTQAVEMVVEMGVVSREVGETEV